jgi:hypothetical protein
VRARAATLLAAAAVAALAGCGGKDSPNQVLSETAGKLGDIRSGVMVFDVRASGRGAGRRAQIGFRVDGPFALARGGALPVAKLRYTQRSGSRQASATVISTGKEAFVEAGGRTRRLGAAQARQLRSAAGQVSSDGGVRKLRLERWMRHPKLTGGPKVGGDATDRITADVDVAAALKDLAGGLGDPKQLAQAVKRARVEVLTGTEDRLLRRLTLDVDLALDVPEGLRQQLGELVGGEARILFEVADPNRKVSVPRPAEG